jgi:hypothetical protein
LAIQHEGHRPPVTTTGSSIGIGIGVGTGTGTPGTVTTSARVYLALA